MLASNKIIPKDAPTKAGGFELQKHAVNHDRVPAQLPSLSLFTFTFHLPPSSAKQPLW
jgi:hypothetical protein